MKKTIILGYMGVGKSLIGKRLSSKTNVKVFDLDNLIEKDTNLSIKSIFETKGELFFRQKERQILQDLLNVDKKMIIVLGGGTPCYYDNYLLYENENSIYLKGSIDTLYNRLVSETYKRPLIADKSEEELKEFIAKNLFERSFYYNQSKFIVTVDGKSPEEIVDEILNLVES